MVWLKYPNIYVRGGVDDVIFTKQRPTAPAAHLGGASCFLYLYGPLEAPPIMKSIIHHPSSIIPLMTIHTATQKTMTSNTAPEEKRELIYGYEATATFKGMHNQPCRHMTSLCPDRCGHGGNVYTFRLDTLLSLIDPNSKHAKFCTPLEEGQEHCVGEDDLGVHLEQARGLTEGDTVQIAWDHDYVTKGGMSGPERPVRSLVKLV